MSDIVEQLADLLVQATSERSHYYVAKVAKDAMAEINRLRAQVEELDGMWRAAAKARLT